MDLDMTAKTIDDSEADTPPHTAHHTIKPLSYANGAPKNHPPPAYKECMKNHAATIGGHAVDGCGEFLPPPPSAAVSLKCAACGCHRSFHRRDPDSAITPPFLNFRHPLPAGYNVFFGAAEEHHPAPVTPTAENPAGRKRFRTRFSQEQKEKMQSFSARLGWKMQRCDEAAVKEFCHEIGVTKGVLKVWMHNNKNTFVKRDVNGGALISSDEDGGGGGGGGGHFQNKSNGSSSSQ